MILDIDEARHLKAKRIRGFFNLRRAGLNTPDPIKIVSHEVFLKYKKERRFDEEFLKALKDSLREIKEKNPRKNIIGRCGLYVPGVKYIPAPRSSMIKTVNGALSFVKEVYETVLKFNLYKPNSQICVIFHPFICPQINETGAQVFTSYDKERKLVVIESIFGNDEGVQSFPHDVFVVNSDYWKIVYRKVSRKTKCMSALGGKWKIAKVPEELQEKPTLSDDEVLEIAREAKKMESMFGPCVLEFMYMFGKRYYTDYRSYEPKGSFSDFFENIHVSEKLKEPIEGEVLRIKDERDLMRTNKYRIFFLDREVVARRDLKLILRLAEKTKATKGREVIIYPGRHTTAHYILALKEAGNIIVFAPDEDVKTGEVVRITNERIERV